MIKAASVLALISLVGAGVAACGSSADTSTLTVASTSGHGNDAGGVSSPSPASSSPSPTGSDPGTVGSPVGTGDDASVGDDGAAASDDGGAASDDGGAASDGAAVNSDGALPADDAACSALTCMTPPPASDAGTCANLGCIDFLDCVLFHGPQVTPCGFTQCKGLVCSP